MSIRFTRRFFIAVLLMFTIAPLTGRAAEGLEPVWPELQAQFGDELKQFSEVFTALYAEDILEARKTRGVADDLLAAKRLVASAEDTDQKPLKGLMCQYAYLTGLTDPRGHEHAQAAIDMLLKATPPEQQGPWKIKAADLLKARAEAAEGDEQKMLGKQRVALLTEVAAMHTAAKRHEAAAKMYEQAIEASRAINDINGTLALKEKHEQATAAAAAMSAAAAQAAADAKMKAEREAAAKLAAMKAAATAKTWQAIIESDDPAAAITHAKAAGLTDVAELATLAAKLPSSLDAADSVRVGEWYAGLVKRAKSADQKMAMLMHAWAFTRKGNPAHASLPELGQQIIDRGYPEVDLFAGPLPAVERRPTLSNKVGMRLLLVPAGTFERGSEPEEKNRRDDESMHTVKLTQSYYIGATEVTQLQWKQVMGTYPAKFKGDGLPVENVSWTQAMAFCNKLSEMDGRRYRLPSEAEWEYACRAGQRGLFANGARVSELAWYQGNSASKTQAVGGKGPNAWGLYDMHGNVAEWCWDVYSDYPTGGELTNPSGPRTGSQHVVRGGAWSDGPYKLRSAARDKRDTDTQSPSIGFRVVIDPFVKSGGSGRVTFFGIGK